MIIGSDTVGNDSLPSINNMFLVEGMMHSKISINQLRESGYVLSSIK